MPRTRRTAPQTVDAQTAIADHSDPLQLVLDAIRGAPQSGRLGTRKMLVSTLYDLVGARLGVTLEELEAWLLRQHFDGKITLARADLVSVTDPDLGRRSEVDHRRVSTAYRFVVDPSAR